MQGTGSNAEGSTAEIDYGAAGVFIGADLRAAHEDLLGHLARPGTWWNGAERVAIAAESRHAAHCSLCRERRAALSPGWVGGAHDSLGRLPEPVVEAIHRIRSDPARLSRVWFDALLDRGLDETRYVELVAVVALVAGIDFFARALDIAPFELPEPESGEPSQRRPAAATPGTAWVPMVAPEDATGPEADLYGGTPFVPNIMRALSLVPDEARALQRSSAAHYLPADQIPDPTARRALDRMQMELVAARVSALNQCFY